MDRAKVEQAVFDFLRPQLKKYREQSTDLARGAASSIMKVTQHAEHVVNERRRQLKRAEAELESCQAQEGADCSGYARKVEECRRALERAIRGRDLIHQASNRFRHSQSKHTGAVDQLLIRGEKLVRTADERTISYQKYANYNPSTRLLSATPLGGGAASGLDFLSGGAASSGGVARGGVSGDGGRGASASSASTWRDLPGVETPAHLPHGFAMVPIKLISNDNPVTGVGDFDQSQDVPGLSWACEALFDVVLPAMVKVKDPQKYLRDRDERENLSGSRSYAATYSGFFGVTPIKLSPSANGTFDLGNGRHRLWLLSRSGADVVPAYIQGGNA